ncbi:MAG: hypothetical protein OHK0022_07150 [Roseiflexaceae bacterium]
MPVRQVRQHGGNIIGQFPSLKTGHVMPYESSIERDFLFFLEYDPTVLRYAMQPMEITGTDAGGKTRHYTPDVLVERASSKTLVECKPAALLDAPHTHQQIALGEHWATANGYDFVVITDVDLRTGHRLSNLQLLWRYARLLVPYAVIERCRAVLQAAPHGLPWSTLLALLEGFAPPLTLPPALYHLLFQHVLTANMDEPLTPASVVSLATHSGRP